MVHQRKKGFTLIELIIAITILAILAVGLIAALDPVEQLTKARDTTVRDNIDTIAGALERYYAVNETYPTGIGLMGDGDGTPAYDLQDPPTANNQAENVIADLIGAGEIKTGFDTVNSTNLSKIWIYRKDVTLNGVDVSTPVIFAKVDSKAMSSQKNLYTMHSDDVSPPQVLAEALSDGNHLPYFGVVNGVNCSIASTTGARKNCAFCIELQK